MEVGLNVSQDTRSEPDWRQVKLLFVRGVKGPGEGDVGKKDWALFVTTDVGLSISKMLGPVNTNYDHCCPTNF